MRLPISVWTSSTLEQAATTYKFSGGDRGWKGDVPIVQHQHRSHPLARLVQPDDDERSATSLVGRDARRCGTGKTLVKDHGGRAGVLLDRDGVLNEAIVRNGKPRRRPLRPFACCRGWWRPALSFTTPVSSSSLSRTSRISPAGHKNEQSSNRCTGSFERHCRSMPSTCVPTMMQIAASVESPHPACCSLQTAGIRSRFAPERHGR